MRRQQCTLSQIDSRRLCCGMWMLRRLPGSRQPSGFHCRCSIGKPLRSRNLNSTTQNYGGDPEQPTKPEVKKTNKQQRNCDEQAGKQLDNRSLFDPRYLAEVYQEFYRELANAYAGFVNGFKKYK
ncbi:hypothetical protein TcWFU_001961 [Taenia crassiceps]|uniref:Uncharacterized protein n=1 Tax=Taenia crassiceps TaxID=6207 RepID=A0ABR4Q0N3_9CEST